MKNSKLKALEDNEIRYRGLFEFSPISLWEEDFTGVKKRLDALKKRGVKDFSKYFKKHPEEVKACAKEVKVIDVNKRTLEMYKARDKKTLLKGLPKGKDSMPMFTEELIALAEGKTRFASEAITYTLDGEKIDIALSLTVPPGYEDTLSRVFVSMIDITKEKAVDRAKSEFVSLVSHQLRDPLGAINWAVEVLVSGDFGDLTPGQKKYVDEIRSDNDKMTDLVNAYLDVSRLELGTFVSDLEMLDLRELAEGIFSELEAKINSKKLKILKKYGRGLKHKVDKKLMTIVLENLLSNAVKYTPSKGTVKLEISKGKKGVLIKVSDTGCGIPKGQQAEVFDKLFRAANARKVDPDGTGLGIYLVKKIVDHLGGEISFESEEGKGASFVVRL